MRRNHKKSPPSDGVVEARVSEKGPRWPARRSNFLTSSACTCAWVLLCGPVASAAEDFGKFGRGPIDVVGSVQRLVEETYTPHDPGRRLVFTRTFDPNGRVMETQVALQDKAAPPQNRTRRAVVMRDEAGRVIEERVSDGSGGLTAKEVSRYDQHGHVVEQVTYQPTGAESTKWLYAYDDRGRETDMRYYLAGVLRARYAYEHDERGNTIKTVAFRQDQSLEYTIVAKFDEKNRRTESLVYRPTGDVARRETFHYGDQGYVTEHISYHPDGSVIEKQVLSYEFDQQGNWIKRTTSKQVVPAGKLESIEIAQRTITYSAE